jgi:DNA (cytosine-5)-methyltransferase 1
MVDLFSGCGGVTQAFKKNGYKVLAAIEFHPAAASTFRANHQDVIFYEEDIRNIQPELIMVDCGLAPRELTVLSVCAPCQPFSRQYKSKKKDSRSHLVLETIRFTEKMKPQFLFMENVPGIAKGKNQAVLNELINVLRNKLGYTLLDPVILNAVNYGVPQHRERLFLLGSRDGNSLSLPPQTHFPPEIATKYDFKTWKTVRDAFAGLHKLASGQQSRVDPLHKARKHSSLNIERLKHIPKNGGSRKSLPEELQLSCHKKTNGYNDVYGRLHFHRPSNTLTTGCTNFTKGRFAHPTANRAITLREAARLQTFPDTYIFKGTYEQISAQIGNAVPVRFAEAFAKHFLNTELLEN